MFDSFKRLVPVLRVDWLPVRELAAVPSSDRLRSVTYAFSTDPETRVSVTSWREVQTVVRSIGTRAETTSVRLEWTSGEHRCAAEVLGSAAHNRMFVRWEDSHLPKKSAPNPWYVTAGKRAGAPGRVPMGDVPKDLDTLTDEQVDANDALDFAYPPEEAVLSEAEVVAALASFMAAGSAEASGMLEWEKR